MDIASLFDGEAGAAWRLFSQVCAIPRPSKHEAAIRDWLHKEATARGWSTRCDSVGNIVMCVPGEGELANAPALALQGHMDMVCEKNADVDHDFLKDPIRPYVDGDWVRAKGTTLGADNGVAIALAMAVAGEDLPDRMPLELLFTIDEETGLGGALGLAPEILTARRLLNLDCGEDGRFVIGCVGGIDTETRFQCSPLAGPMKATECRLTGLRGGHSGVDIRDERTNAIIFAAQLLRRLGEVQVLSFTGGSKKNAIPREATFAVAGDCRVQLIQAAKEMCAEIRDKETGVNVDVSATELECGRDIPWNAIEFLRLFPNGILEVEKDFPEIIRSSNSIGVVHLEDHAFCALAHGRSSTTDGRQGVVDRVQQLADSTGGTMSVSGDYPGWAPNATSQLLSHAKRVHRDVFGTEPEFEAVHAGLEAGIIGDKIGTSELLAYGPTIRNAHSPDESLGISSFNQVYRLLKAFVSTPMGD